MADTAELSELSAALRFCERPGSGVPSNVIEAARAHLAHLRAPKGELEEARAELGAWLAGAPGWFHSTFESVSCTATPETAWSCRLAHNQGGIHYSARGPTEAAAIRAALSRARGEGS